MPKNPNKPRRRPPPDRHEGRLPLEEVMPLISCHRFRMLVPYEDRVYLINANSLRLNTFKKKGTVCACCGRQATHFKLTFTAQTPHPHFNLFDDDDMMFTHDHIMPRSKGGKDAICNTQTMCSECNHKKGAMLPEEWEAYLAAI